jgi:hypothetical protein
MPRSNSDDDRRAQRQDPARLEWPGGFSHFKEDMTMIRQTIGRLMLDKALPENLRGGSEVLDKQGIATLFDKLAKEHPDKYREVSKALTDIGADVAQATGGFSFGLDHLAPSQSAERIKSKLRQEFRNIQLRRDLDATGKEKAVTDLLASYQKPLDEAVFNDSVNENNPLAHQVKNVGRGNKASLKALRSGDLLYEDHHDRPIPIPVLSSYSHGLDPSEYFAASFGARKGVVDVKLSTANAGAFGKQLSQVAHRLVVTGHDYDDDNEDRSDRGLPVDVSDPDNVGALLARPVAGLPRNTVLTPGHLAHLKSKGITRILARRSVKRPCRRSTPAASPDRTRSPASSSSTPWSRCPRRFRAAPHMRNAAEQ